MMTLREACTQLLLNFDEAGANFVDSSPLARPLTKLGAGLQSSASSKFGSYCYSSTASSSGAYEGLLAGECVNPQLRPYVIRAWLYLPANQPASAQDTWRYVFMHGGYAVTNPLMAIEISTGKLAARTSTGTIYSTAAIPLNQWVFCEIFRDSNLVTRMRIDGVLQDQTGVGAASMGSAGTSVLCVGTSFGVSSTHAIGRIDSLEYLVGLVLDPADYVAPTNPWPTGASDPLWSDVALLLAGTSLTDASANALTPTQIGSSNVVSSSAQLRYGNNTLEFSGTAAIRYASNALFAVTSDFTLEFDVLVNEGTTTVPHLVQFEGADVNNRLNINITNGAINLYTQAGAGTGGARIIAAGTPRGQWMSIALSRKGGTNCAFHLHVNGEHRGSYGLNGAVVPTGNLALTIGTQGFSPLANDYLNGYIANLRISRNGVRAWSPDAAVPTAPSTISGAISPAVPRTALKLFDLWDGGLGEIVSTVKVDSTPSDLPRRERVLLLRERDGRVIRATHSDAVAGEYAFRFIDPTQKYSVISHDHTHDKRAVIADNLTPDLMVL